MGDGKAAVRRRLPQAASYIDDFVTALAKRHDLPPRRIALFGFSQGAVAALYAGPRLEYELAGIAALAGYVVDDAQAVRQRPPVFLSHGADDGRIAFAEMAAARSALAGAGFAVTTQAVPDGGHEIGGVQTMRAAAFLAAALDRE
jgi:phospholipase/carboxylesterase